MNRRKGRMKYNHPSENRIIGFCKYHGWRMSAAQVKNKGCLSRENTGFWCRHFRPRLESSFWAEHKIPESILTKILSKFEPGPVEQEDAEQ